MRFIIILLCLLLICEAAYAETVYILCQPDSYVNIRSAPKKSAEVIGWYELGFECETDGVKKYGFLHLINLGLESETGWVNAGFVSRYPLTIETVKGYIQADGRVACRRAVNGQRRKWLTDGAEVVIYARSDGWSITNQGFIQTAYLGGILRQ